MTDKRTYYELLRVDSIADSAQIRLSYRELATRYHPDSPEGDAEMFRLLTDAWRVLSDPVKREWYDRELRGEKGH